MHGFAFAWMSLLNWLQLAMAARINLWSICTIVKVYPSLLSTQMTASPEQWLTKIFIVKCQTGHSEIKTYSIEYCAIVLGVCNILGVASTQGVKLLAIMGELSKL